MRNKKELSAQDIYKLNQKKAKVCKILAPIVFWVALALAVVALFFALHNSFGNIAEIMDLLDNDKYTNVEIQQHYNMLCEKWGVWTIGTGGSGFTISFVDIRKALVNVPLIVNGILSIIFVALAFVFGKWFLPMLSKHISEGNTDMVNLTILKNSENKQENKKE